MQFKQLTWFKGKWSGDLPTEWNNDHTLIMSFFASKFSTSGPWKELQEKFPKSILFGCSGAGEVLGDQILDGKISFTFVHFSKTKLKAIYSAISSTESSYASGKEFAKKVDRNGLKGIYLLTEGININGTEVIKGINETLGQNLFLSGGLAGDGVSFSKTFVIKDGMPTSNFISGVAFYGHNIILDSVALGGWQAYGPQRKVTKSEGNVLFEIDNKPALSIYKEYLGKHADNLPSSGLLLPLYLGESDKGTRETVRTVLSVNEAEQSLTFAGDIPNGMKVQFMRASINDLVKASEMAVQKTVEQIDQKRPALCVVVSCLGRKLVMGEQTEHELERVFSHLPKGSVQTGFYSYGEIAPARDGHCELHNQTMAITLVQEVEK